MDVHGGPGLFDVVGTPSGYGTAGRCPSPRPVATAFAMSGITRP
jgi:hypothetical protein